MTLWHARTFIYVYYTMNTMRGSRSISHVCVEEINPSDLGAVCVPRPCTHRNMRYARDDGSFLCPGNARQQEIKTWCAFYLLVFLPSNFRSILFVLLPPSPCLFISAVFYRERVPCENGWIPGGQLKRDNKPIKSSE